MAPASGAMRSKAGASPILPSETWINEGTGQIEQRVHLDRRFSRTKISPRKQRKAQIDCCAVERIDRVGEIKANVVFDIKLARALDEDSGQIEPYAPIA